MLKLEFKYTDLIVKELMKIEKYVSNINQLYLPTKIKQKLIYEAKLKKTHFSTSIEGNILSLSQVENVIKQKNDNRLKMEQEVANYWDALTFLENAKLENKDIDLKFVIELQSIIERKGKVNKNGFREATPPGVLFAVRDDKTGYIDYIPPQASDIKECMNDLIDWYNSHKELPVPIIAGIMHYGLTTIHPFEDGNGRTSRALATYILMINNYDLRGFNYLEEYYMRDLEGYYNNLQMGLPAMCYDGRLNPPKLEIWLEYFVRTMSLNAEQVYELALEASKGETKQISISNLEKKDLLLIKYILENNKETIKPKELTDLFQVTSRAIIKWCAKWVEKDILIANYRDKNIISYSLSSKMKSITLKDIGFVD